MNPKLAGKVEIGGIARGTAHPNGRPFVFGPQMVEISRDGKRVYWTPTRSIRHGTSSSIPRTKAARWSWPMWAKTAGWSWTPDFYIEFPKGYRSHQIRLEGGDCSTDSFCYPSV